MPLGSVVNVTADGQRAFLQGFLARRTVTLTEARNLIAEIHNRSSSTHEETGPINGSAVSQESVEALITRIQDVLESYDYEVRSMRHPVKKEMVWALVNTTSDTMTQIATLRNPDEMAFVRRIIDAMFDTYNTPRMEVMCLDSLQANKFAKAPPPPANEEEDDEQTRSQQPKGLTASQAETVMRNMVEEKYFEVSPEGFYSLGPLALMELRSWLVESYNDPDVGEGEWQRIKFCEACRSIVTAGQRCANRDCNMRLHEICMDAYWRTRPQRSCPRCSTAWDGKHFVGPRAITESKTFQNSRRKSGRPGRASHLLEKTQDDENEEEEERAPRSPYLA